MRKTIYLTALILLAGFSAGVVGHECPPGQVCIMSGGGDSGHGAISKNGSDWNSTLKVEDISPENNISERLVNVTFNQKNGSYQVSFDGVMKVNSACYRPVYEVSGQDSNYRLNIFAEKMEDSTCTQAITRIDYKLEFESEKPLMLEVVQGNISETFQHPDYSENSSKEQNSQKPSEEKGGVFSALFSWIGGLF